MQITSLYTFITVAKQKSMSRAARILYVSQPAVTQQIRRMEKELGFELFEHGRGNELILSPAGKQFFEFSEKALQEYEEAVAACRKTAENRISEIRIGLKSTDLQLLKQETVDTFALRHPDVHLAFTYDHPNMPELLFTEQLDMIFTSEPSSIPAGYAFHHVCDDTISCIVRSDHPLAKRKKVTFQDLKPYQLFVLKDPSSDSIRLLHYIRENYPNMHVDSSKDYSMTVSPGFKGVRLCPSADASRFHFSTAVPLQTGFRCRKGYLCRPGLDEDAMDFVRLNIKAAEKDQ